MSLYKTYEPGVSVTAAIEPALGRHWVKRLARRMGVPTPTARHWIYIKMPVARHAEIAEAILAECDVLEVMIAETRQRFRGEIHEAAGELARGEARAASPPAGAIRKGVK